MPPPTLDYRSARTPRRGAVDLEYRPVPPRPELASLKWRATLPAGLLFATLTGLTAAEIGSGGGLASPLLTGGLFVAFVLWVISAAAFFELLVLRGEGVPRWVWPALWLNAPSVLLPPAAMLLALLAAVVP